MGKRSKKELLFFLQENQIARVSYKGLIEKHPDALSMLKGAYLMLEIYEMLPLFDDIEKKIDENYFLFINPSNRFVIFEIKESYPEKQYIKLLKRCGVEVES